jgi:pimeloyl-ACP methyl ester carboxylesterase
MFFFFWSPFCVSALLHRGARRENVFCSVIEKRAGDSKKKEMARRVLFVCGFNSGLGAWNARYDAVRAHFDGESVDYFTYTWAECAESIYARLSGELSSRKHAVVVAHAMGCTLVARYFTRHPGALASYARVVMCMPLVTSDNAAAALLARVPLIGLLPLPSFGTSWVFCGHQVAHAYREWIPKLDLRMLGRPNVVVVYAAHDALCPIAPAVLSRVRNLVRVRGDNDAFNSRFFAALDAALPAKPAAVSRGRSGHGPAQGDCRFEYEALAAGDATYEHDFTVNVGEYAVTYCVQLRFQSYKQGECVGIKSLLPGQKLSHRRTATYSKVVYDESGKQIGMADSTSSESELMGSVATNLSNLAQASETKTTSSTWNAGGGASGGLDFGIFDFSFGGGGGGGGSEEQVITSVSDVFESVITNSVTKTKNTKAASNMASFSSLHASTVSLSDTSDTVDAIENLSKSRVAIYHFYTMYKRYECRQFIKSIKRNPIVKSVGSYNPSLFPVFMPHKSTQSASLETLARLAPLCKDESELGRVRALIGENGLIGTNGAIVRPKPAEAVRPAPAPAVDDDAKVYIADYVDSLESLRRFEWTPVINDAGERSPAFAEALERLVYVAHCSDEWTVLAPEKQAVLVNVTALLLVYAHQAEPMSDPQILGIVTSVNGENGIRVHAPGRSSVPGSGRTAALTDEAISQLIAALDKTTTILLPIEGLYVKGENTCEMKFTAQSEPAVPWVDEWP